MGCSALPCLEDYAYLCSIYSTPEAYKAAKMQEEMNKKIKLKIGSFTNAQVFAKDPTLRDFPYNASNKQNIELYMKIREENDRLVPLLKAKLDELRIKQLSKTIMIGKANCGKPCYAYNPSLFTNCPECKGKVQDDYENGTYKKQVLDKERNQYVWKEFYNEENICLKFTFNENVEPCDIDFNKLCDFFDKEDKEKTVHWSYINSSNQPVEKDLPIHYMMIDGERFDFPYGLQMREFFYMNDENLFPVSGSGWEDKGKCFGLFEEETKLKIGKSIGFYGVNMLKFVIIYKCTSCNLQYHIIRTCPLMHRDKSKDPK